MLIAVQDRPDLNLKAFVGKLIFIIPAGMIPPPEIIQVLYGVSADSSDPDDREKFERLRTTKYDEARYAIEHPDKGMLIVPQNLFDKGCKPIDPMAMEEIDAKPYYYISFFSKGRMVSALIDENPVEWALKNGTVILQLIPISEKVFKEGVEIMKKHREELEEMKKLTAEKDKAEAEAKAESVPDPEADIDLPDDMAEDQSKADS